MVQNCLIESIDVLYVYGSREEITSILASAICLLKIASKLQLNDSDEDLLNAIIKLILLCLPFQSLPTDVMREAQGQLEHCLIQLSSTICCGSKFIAQNKEKTLSEITVPSQYFRSCCDIFIVSVVLEPAY